MKTKDNIWMPAKDICGSYYRMLKHGRRHPARISKKKNQIKILADLNDCLPRHIIEILLTDPRIDPKDIPNMGGGMEGV